MNTRMTLFTIGAIVIALVLGFVAGAWFINTAIAQAPWQRGNWGMMHNNQALFDLLKTNESELLKERQAGTSLLEIAKAKGVSEDVLVGALLQPMTQMHAWMGQNYPQSNPAQMTAWMQQQFAQDIRVAQYGTMTDMHLFGGSMMNGMMGYWNGSNGYGGMMGNGNGGMMGGWNNAPTRIP